MGIDGVLRSDPKGDMLLRNFRVKLVLRIAVILLTTVLIGMVLLRTEWRMAVLILILLLFWQIWELIRFVDKTNQDLERFFDAIRYSDFTQSFSVEGLGTSFDGLKAAFSRVFEAFQETRAEKAAQARYLETVVQHVRTGLIAFRTGDNRVILYNNAARRLLQDITSGLSPSDQEALAVHPWAIEVGPE